MVGSFEPGGIVASCGEILALSTTIERLEVDTGALGDHLNVYLGPSALDFNQRSVLDFDMIFWDINLTDSYMESLASVVRHNTSLQCLPLGATVSSSRREYRFFFQLCYRIVRRP